MAVEHVVIIIPSAKLRQMVQETPHDEESLWPCENTIIIMMAKNKLITHHAMESQSDLLTFSNAVGFLPVGCHWDPVCITSISQDSNDKPRRVT